MCFTLLLSLLLTADGSQRVGNGRQLVEKDMSFAVIYTDGKESTTISLREGDRWDAGAVWIIQEGCQNDRPFGYKAYKGVYHIYAGEDHNVLLIKIGLSRKYTALPAERLRWTLDPDFEPQGADLEVSLDENHDVPKDNIRVLIARGFFADKEGNEITKYREPVGFAQKLTGRGNPVAFEKLDFYSVGETFTAGPMSWFVLDLSSPPGFIDRGRLSDAKKK